MELSLIRSLMDKEFYDEHRGAKCPDRLFSKDVRKIKQSGGFTDVQVVPLVSADVVAQRRRDLAASARPENAMRLSEVEQLSGAVQSLIDTARQEITKVANLPASEAA